MPRLKHLPSQEAVKATILASLGMQRLCDRDHTDNRVVFTSGMEVPDSDPSPLTSQGKPTPHLLLAISVFTTAPTVNLYY